MFMCFDMLTVMHEAVSGIRRPVLNFFWRDDRAVFTDQYDKKKKKKRKCEYHIE